MMAKLWFVTGASAVIALAMVSSPASAQDVRQHSDGSYSVHYPGPCTVYYDRYGRRVSDTRACNGTQRRLADAAVRARLGGSYGYGGNYGYSQNYGYRDPIIRVREGGWGMVDLRNGCIVTFNRDGNRVTDTRPCNGVMREHARRMYAERIHGGSYYPGGNYGDGGYGYSQPRLSVQGNTIRVDMSGYNCTYIYTTGGNHIQSLGNQCNSRLRDIANQAQRDWREGRR